MRAFCTSCGHVFIPSFSFQTVIKAHCGCPAARIKRSHNQPALSINPKPSASTQLRNIKGFFLCFEAVLQLEHPAGSGLVHFVLHLLLCFSKKRQHYVWLFHYSYIIETSLHTELPSQSCLSPLSGSFTSGEDSLEPASEDRKCLQRSESCRTRT